MPAAEIVVLRAYAKYMRQIGFPLSQAFVEARSPRIPPSRGCWSSSSGCASTRRPAEAGAVEVIAKIQQIDDALDRVDNLSKTACSGST